MRRKQQMSLTPSTMLSLGTAAPDFSLPDIEGNTVSLSDFEEGKPLLVVFMCNHCPYVKHIQQDFAVLVSEYQEKGVNVVGINANDVQNYPEDSPENMARDSKTFGYTFDYLYDESQEVAKSYRAACTPDFFLFDRDRRLFYRGQMDASRPGNDIPITGNDLRDSLDRVLAGDDAPEVQRPSMGCNIKWKAGNEPDYFG
jgi:peroxiredoxin